MTLKGIPSTNPHKLSAERVARVVKATVKILVERGVLLPPPAEPAPTKPESGKSRDEGQLRSDQFSGILDCRSQTAYLALIDGGKPENQ